MSVALTSALASFESAPLTNDTEADQEFLGTWQPFDVMFVPGEALRARYAGSMFGGTIWGGTFPCMLDMSSSLFLRDGDKTLEAIVLSPGAMKMLLSELIGGWQRRFEYDTFMWEALESFERLGPLTADRLMPNKVFLNNLAASREEPLVKRPVVRVWGTPVVEGVVIASVLQVGDMRAVFLPSGYFQAFADAARPFVGETKMPLPIQLQQG